MGILGAKYGIAELRTSQNRADFGTERGRETTESNKERRRLSHARKTICAVQKGAIRCIRGNTI